MQTILNNYKELINGRKKLNEDLTKEIKYLKANYSGESLDRFEANTRENYRIKIARLEENHTKAIKDEYQQTNDNLRKSIMKPIPEDTLNMIRSIEGITLSKAEKEALMKMTENNYMARRKVLDILPPDYERSTPSVDLILHRIDELEQAMDKTIRNKEYDYMTAIMENGDWVNKVEAEASSFLEAYE